MPEEASAVSLRGLVVAVAGPQQASDNRKSLIARAARNAGISFRSVKAVWYNEIDDPNHAVVRLLQHAAERRTKADAAANAAARREALQTFRRLLAMRDALAAKDEAFHRADIDALECALGSMVGEPLPGNFPGD